MATAVVRVEGADALADGLRRTQKNAANAIRGSNRDVARQVRDWSRAAAQGGTGLQRRMAGGIGSRATTANAQLTVRNTVRAPGATVAFWGAKRRSGWYAAERYASSATAQHPPWVGNTWAAATPGQGPHVLNDVLAARADEIGVMYLDGQWESLERALPRTVRAR